MIKFLLPIMKGQRKDEIAHVITWALLPFSYIYGLAVFCHRHFYRLMGAYKAPKPVISIGNITVGGVGKTPIVIWLARILEEKGLKPVILTRGYMAEESTSSDEADMLNEQIPNIPVLTGANRVANIVKSEGVLPVDVYVCDDAFQHWPLRRDLNVVAIDAGNPFGNGYLLPAGILREPLSALKRADVFILTKIDPEDDLQALLSKLKGINAQALVVESRYKSMDVVDVFGSGYRFENFLKEKSVVGFCAIGDPNSFKSSLENTGVNVVIVFTYMDHHVYTRDEIEYLVHFTRLQSAKTLVTTHKDAVKLRAFKDLFTDIRLVYMPIQLEIIKGSDEFIQKVISVCRH